MKTPQLLRNLYSSSTSSEAWIFLFHFAQFIVPYTGFLSKIKRDENISTLFLWEQLWKKQLQRIPHKKFKETSSTVVSTQFFQMIKQIPQKFALLCIVKPNYWSKKIWLQLTNLHIKNPTIFNIICWVGGSLGWSSHWPSVWCSKYFFFIKSCKILCKNPFNYFFYKITKMKIKSFECHKSIRNYEKKNTWNVRRLVDEFVPSAQLTSVLYCRLSNF